MKSHRPLPRLGAPISQRFKAKPRQQVGRTPAMMRWSLHTGAGATLFTLVVLQVRLAARAQRARRTTRTVRQCPVRRMRPVATRHSGFMLRCSCYRTPVRADIN